MLLRVHPEVVKTLKANNARWLNELEEMSGKTIIVKSDPGAASGAIRHPLDGGPCRRTCGRSSVLLRAATIVK